MEKFMFVLKQKPQTLFLKKWESKQGRIWSQPKHQYATATAQLRIAGCITAAIKILKFKHILRHFKYDWYAYL